MAPPVPVVAPILSRTADVPKDLPPLKVVQVIDGPGLRPIPERADAGRGCGRVHRGRDGAGPDAYADSKAKPALDRRRAGRPGHLKVMPRLVDPFTSTHIEDPGGGSPDS